MITELKFILNFNVGLENIVSRELNYILLKNNTLLTENSLFTSFYIELKKTILPGKILLSVSLKIEVDSKDSTYLKDINKQNSRNLASNSLILYKVFYDKILCNLQTIISFDIILNEVPLDEIFGKKFDDFRFIEELNYSITKILQIKEHILKNLNFANTKISLRNNGSNEKIKKEINDLSIKKINLNGLLNKKKSNLDSETGNADKIVYTLKVHSNTKDLMFYINCVNIYFGNLLPNKILNKHPTPIGLPIANSMIFENLHQIQLLYQNTNQKSFKDIKNLVFVDPFCGFGTIPIILYIDLFQNYSDIISKLSNNNLKIKLIGLDHDKIAWDNALNNYDRIKHKIIQESLNKNKNYQEPMEVEFIQDKFESFEEIVEEFNPDTTIISIITQPPYGFSIEMDDSEIEELYKTLIKLTCDLSAKYNIFLSLLTGQIDLINNIESDLKLNLIENNLILNKKYEFYKKKVSYAMYFFHGK